MADNSDIVINFKKENGNIFLKSIEDDGKIKDYKSDLPLLSIDEEGKYTSIEGALDKVVVNEKPEEKQEGELVEPVTEAENFEFSDDIYPQTDNGVGVNPLLGKENKNEPQEPATNEAQEPATNEAQEPATNECEDKFNIYNTEIANADCNTINKNFKKLAAKVHPDKNPNCGDASTETMKNLNNKKEECENSNGQPEAVKELQDATTGGKKNRTKKSKKGGKQKTKRVRFVMTRKGRKNRKNKTRR